MNSLISSETMLEGEPQLRMSIARMEAKLQELAAQDKFLSEEARKLAIDHQHDAAKSKIRQVANTRRLIQTISKDVSFLYKALHEIEVLKSERLPWGENLCEKR